MLLADSSVWIDHIRKPEPLLLSRLAENRVIMHPYVLGEIALGGIKNRLDLMKELSDLIRSEIADHDEVMTAVERYKLFGLGIGYVDAHLVTATLLTPGARLWTRDRRLNDVAERLGVATTGEG